MLLHCIYFVELSPEINYLADNKIIIIEQRFLPTLKLEHYNSQTTILLLA